MTTDPRPNPPPDKGRGDQSSAASASRAIGKYREGCYSVGDDMLAVEEPLEIRVGDCPIAITMRTPGSDRELVAGFCLTEGIIEEGDELESVEPCDIAKYGNVVVVKLTEEAARRREGDVRRARRESFLSSSCGLCGKESIARIKQHVRPLRGDFTVSRSVLDSLPGVMREAQSAFDKTGGLHAAGVFSPEGKLRALREDVGRHNAVDKVIGQAVLTNQLPLDKAVLMISGRASFEIIQKAAVAGITVVAAVSAPTTLAVDTARELDLTLVGFLRAGRMNVYWDRKSPHMARLVE